MIMVRELTDDEILDVVDMHRQPSGLFNMLELARALFEAARIQQTVRE